ncbi:MAG TPA: protease inhibitor I42 family protein [Ktedonobacteraceae bacterium]|nr:protease inhibitor I42 family protein [Ktedonobacteraceae bacterium]
MQQCNESSNGQELDLQTGQKFEVRLPENPTSGFRWKLVSSGEPACEALEDVYEPPDPGIHGQEGMHYWRFEAVQAGYGQIELAYRRSWEPAENAARRFTLEIRVKE